MHTNAYGYIYNINNIHTSTIHTSKHSYRDRKYTDTNFNIIIKHVMFHAG